MGVECVLYFSSDKTFRGGSNFVAGAQVSKAPKSVPACCAVSPEGVKQSLHGESEGEQHGESGGVRSVVSCEMQGSELR